MARFPSLLPDFRSMTLYNTTWKEQDGRVLYEVYTGTISNMTHPPLYYLLMALLGGVQVLPDGSAAVDIQRLRVLNMALSASAVLLAYYLGYTRIKSRSPLTHALYAFAVATLPMLAYVGTSINNDNLAFLALVVFFAGLLRYEEDRLDWRTYTLIGLGFLVGGMTKLTTALMCLLMLGTVLMLDVIRTKSLRLILNKAFLILLPCILLFLLYEVWIRRTYGSWQPSLYNLDPEYFYRTEFYTSPEKRLPLTLVQFAKRFAEGMGHTWSSFYGETPTLNERMHNGVFGIVYWIPVLLTVFAAVRGLVKKNRDRLALPVTVGFLGAMGYHFYSNWSGYPISGYLGGCQARYYLAMIVPLAYIMCTRIPPLLERRKTIARVLAVLLIAAWIAGDGLKLLLYVAIPGLTA
jgi:4-amino-4-deoxy-L-arabinose transferase-like glycosyltransferase